MQSDEHDWLGCFLGIDPGPEESAVVSLTNGRVDRCDEKIPNATLMVSALYCRPLYVIAIEDFVPYAQRLGYESMETIKWIGAMSWVFCDAVLIPRPEIKLHLCGKKTAADADVRDALIQRFGPGRKRAIGTKKAPGPLYGVAGHCWSALSVAVTAQDQAAEAAKAECGGKTTEAEATDENQGR